MPKTRAGPQENAFRAALRSVKGRYFALNFGPKTLYSKVSRYRALNRVISS